MTQEDATPTFWIKTYVRIVILNVWLVLKSVKDAFQKQFSKYSGTSL